jgi:Na+/phosphate symporter
MLANWRQMYSAVFLFMSASWQKIGSILIATGGILMALDIIGPQLTKLEDYLNKLSSWNTLGNIREGKLLNKLPTQRDIAGILIGFLFNASLIFALREDQREWDQKQGEKRLIVDLLWFAIFLLVVRLH